MVGTHQGQQSGMLFIGIDPGVTGAVGAIRSDGSLAEVHDAPVLRVQNRQLLDEREAYRLLGQIKETVFTAPRPCVAVIEWAQASPQMGTVSAFNYGMGFGVWLCALVANAIPFQKVRPQAWKKEMLSGYANPDKSVSIAVARQLWPNVDLGTNKHSREGRSEALLMAEFCRRVHRAFNEEAA